MRSAVTRGGRHTETLGLWTPRALASCRGGRTTPWGSLLLSQALLPTPFLRSPHTFSGLWPRPHSPAATLLSPLPFQIKLLEIVVSSHSVLFTCSLHSLNLLSLRSPPNYKSPTSPLPPNSRHLSKLATFFMW